MILGGFDIASYHTGYFFLDTDNIKYKIGILEMNGSQVDRVRQLHLQSKEILQAYAPDILIIEDTYYDEYRKHTNGTKKRGNINTLKILEKCHGAIISNTDEFTDIFYMRPSEHKQILTGLGSAQKKATIWAIQKKLGLSNLTDDEADAAALVFAYLTRKQQWDILEKINEKFT